jgi:hypothetical protein
MQMFRLLLGLWVELDTIRSHPQTVLLTACNQGWCLSLLFAFPLLESGPTFLEHSGRQVLGVTWNETHITLLAVLNCS